MLSKLKYKAYLLKTSASGFAAAISTSSFAAGETPVSQGLAYITTAMTGSTGVAIATMAIMVVGLLCLSHVLKWSVLGYTIIGISIVFGASSIATGITSLISKPM